MPAADHTCHCECVTEPSAPAAVPPVPAAVPPVPQPEAVQPISGEENAGSAPTTDPTPPRVRQARPEVVGSLDRDIIRRIVRAHISEVRHCYNEGLILDAELSGRVAVQFTIGAAGKVLEAVVASSTLDEDDDEEGVAACITTAVKRWKFPRFEGEAPVVVTYPFVLSPGD